MRVLTPPGAKGRVEKVVPVDGTQADFGDPDVVLPKTVVPDPEAPPITPEDKVVALLKG